MQEHIDVFNHDYNTPDILASANATARGMIKSRSLIHGITHPRFNNLSIPVILLHLFGYACRFPLRYGERLGRGLGQDDEIGAVSGAQGPKERDHVTGSFRREQFLARVTFDRSASAYTYSASDGEETQYATPGGIHYQHHRKRWK
jgi:hypothetical protein